jgi:ubiquinone/menaquinone biosynthesis C-methylase UbiE
MFEATSMPDRAWWAVLWPRPHLVLRSIGIEAGMTVLDLCCGDGYFTAPLAKLVAGKVIALDIDCDMLEQAEHEVAKAGAVVQQWICADAMALASHVTQPVDFVLIANTFHGVPDQAGLARVVRAVLRPTGAFAVINWHPADPEKTPVLGEARGPKMALRLSPPAVVALVEPAGFQLAKLVELPPYHYGTVFKALP